MRPWQRTGLSVVLLVASASMQAQDTAELRVYSELVQVPVMVLNASLRPGAPVSPADFTVELEGKPLFTPQSVRPEGDDPLSIALLVDLSDENDDRWRRLPAAVDALAPSLHSQDHVAIYALDGCALRRMRSADAADHANLHAQALAVLQLHVYQPGSRNAPACPHPVSFWPAAQYIASEIGGQGGRPVILALSDAHPPASTAQMQSVERTLNVKGVAMFGIRPPDAPPPSAERGAVSAGSMYSSVTGHGAPAGTPPAGMSMTRTLANQELGQDAVQSALRSLYSTECQRSGGLLLVAGADTMPRVLKEAVGMLRDRYVLEFRRPDGLAPGAHGITVRDGRPRDILLPTGVSAPVAQPPDAAVQLNGR